MYEKTTVPTDEQIAKFGKQLRKKAELIVKALNRIQKEVRPKKFTTELWNLAVDVAEKKMKLCEAVAILKTERQPKSASFPLSYPRYHIWLTHSIVTKFTDERSTRRWFSLKKIPEDTRRHYLVDCLAMGIVSGSIGAPLESHRKGYKLLDFKEKTSNMLGDEISSLRMKSYEKASSAW